MIFFLAKGAFSGLTKDEGTELVRKFLFSLSQIEHPHSTLLRPAAALTLACFGLAEDTSLTTALFDVWVSTSVHMC
jgi:hypothetical protein